MLATMTFKEKLQRWATRIKRDGVTLWFACRHSKMPWTLKVLAGFVVAYALSPIDLIPDFIPVLGYVDDILLLPALIWLAIRLMPTDVLADCRQKTDAWMLAHGAKPKSPFGALLVVLVWIGLVTSLWFWLIRPWFG
jgi:uncharacterized membrane protein YkvA (DUF1232 family)